MTCEHKKVKISMGTEFSRTEFLKVLVAGGSATLLPFKAATAAVPSVEEYNVGSGSFIKRSEQPASYKRRTFTAPVDSTSALKALDETKDMLNSFGVSVPRPASLSPAG
jgi:hypothetical protein